jgi:hypothetical protein
LPADPLVESGQGPFDDAGKRRDFCRLILWSKVAKALSTTPAKGVTFAGYATVRATSTRE